jgi:hypothetical protein
VDYWDYLGWTDPWSDAAYTNRQNHYANVIDATTMYTPDFWIHGEQVPTWALFNQSAIEGFVDDWLATAAHAEVTVSLASEPTDSPLVIDYAVTDAPAGSDLYVVIVERGLSSVVTSGENNGETLEHENVARGFVTVDPGEGQVNIEPPMDLVVENASIIAFVQDYSTLCMYGADGFDLVP